MSCLLIIVYLLFQSQLSDNLILNRDGYGNKPWIDSSLTAMEQFYNSSNAWEATWGEGDTRGLSVKSVKLFQRGLCST